MSLEYINCRQQQYYIFEGRTKTGKPKYYASKKPVSSGGSPVDSLPIDFEIHENPQNATVTVRRRRPTRVTAKERNLVERLVLELSECPRVRLDVVGDAIVVYTPDTDPARILPKLSSGLGFLAHHLSESLLDTSHYTAMLRFSLQEPATKRRKSAKSRATPKSDEAAAPDSELPTQLPRIWQAARYCFRSYIDGWLSVGRPDELEPLARNFVVHLGRESFYEL
ncbi:MAG: hypothetical protein R3C59_08055 [Planctomycetaceae bacterium]